MKFPIKSDEISASVRSSQERPTQSTPPRADGPSRLFGQKSSVHLSELTVTENEQINANGKRSSQSPTIPAKRVAFEIQTETPSAHEESTDGDVDLTLSALLDDDNDQLEDADSRAEFAEVSATESNDNQSDHVAPVRINDLN